MKDKKRNKKWPCAVLDSQEGQEGLVPFFEKRNRKICEERWREVALAGGESLLPKNLSQPLFANRGQKPDKKIASVPNLRWQDGRGRFFMSIKFGGGYSDARKPPAPAGKELLSGS